MKYLVTKYYSGFCTHEVEAENEDEAYKKAGEMLWDSEQIGEMHEIERVHRTRRIKV